MEYEVIASGNANILYRRSNNSVIRVSKNGVDPCLTCEYWNSFWVPKLGEFMGTMSVVHDTKFGNVLLVDEVGSTGGVVAEFKPKWLEQSPQAPDNARCCRTCAIKQMRKQPLNWCSLSLGLKNADHIAKLADSVALPGHQEKVRDLLLSSSLFDKLRFWQHRLATQLNDCMSLRDCTVMIEYSNAEQDYRIRIVDLDPKLGPEKLAKWAKIEAQLQPYYSMFNDTCILSCEAS